VTAGSIPRKEIRGQNAGRRVWQKRGGPREPPIGVKARRKGGEGEEYHEKGEPKTIRSIALEGRIEG